MNLKDIISAMKGGDDPKKKKTSEEETPSFDTEQEHVDYHRPRAIANLSDEDRAEYHRQESINKGGDAYLALKNAIPKFNKPARPKAKILPEPGYSYQSDRASTPIKLKDKVRNLK